jgi:hypothetical protein
MFVPAVRGIASAAAATAVLSLAAPPALAHHGDDRVRRGSCSGAMRTTGGRSGSFEVRRSTVNSRGTDSFVFRARNTRSGELCVGTVNY